MRVVGRLAAVALVLLGTACGAPLFLGRISAT
jgi:hypothetical protein